jgi:hypothetical protein
VRAGIGKLLREGHTDLGKSPNVAVQYSLTSPGQHGSLKSPTGFRYAIRGRTDCKTKVMRPTIVVTRDQSPQSAPAIKRYARPEVDSPACLQAQEARI